MSESLKEIKFLNDLPDQVIVIDKFKTINFANKSAKTRFGSNIESQNISSIVRDAELLDQIDKSLEKNQGGILDIEIKAPNFQYYKVSVMPGPKNLLNTSDSVIIFFKDLTDIIKVQKLKSDFVANVSHELRTPLQSIKLGLETINNGHASKDLESQKKILPVVLQQTSRMESIVNDLLSLSRIELQEHIRPSEKVDLNEIISHSIDLNKETVQGEIDFTIERISNWLNSHNADHVSASVVTEWTNYKNELQAIDLDTKTFPMQGTYWLRDLVGNGITAWKNTDRLP